MTTDLHRAARIAEQAAYAAGAHLQASRSRLSEVVVTHAEPEAVAQAIHDEALALVRGVVRRQFADHAVVGIAEASAAAASNEGCGQDAPHWIVNPLDGRTNYLRGYPQYAVALTLFEGGEPHVGVVYDPARNEFFGALRGRGAVLNGLPIRCAAPRPPLQALAATVFPAPESPSMRGYVVECSRVLRGFGGLRRSGSLALELAYLAAGRIDAFWAHDAGACDAGAGGLLLRESGALIEARDGLPLLASRSLIACTARLREPLLGLLGPLAAQIAAGAPDTGPDVAGLDAAVPFDRNPARASGVP